MREAGLTAADMRNATQVNAVADAFGFKTMLEAMLDARERAERSVLRRLHRRIKQSASR
jgi:N-methylhydantoinase B/oxoprolinase/acetone carboxylase alpha subunit